MTAPASNLPPDSQAWGDSVEKRIADLNKRIGVAASAAKAANVRTAGAARSAAEATERALQVGQSQTAIVQEVNDKDESTWAPVEPENPQHNHHWYDVADGNVLKIRADYGAYERTNYVLNPTFRIDTQGWTALGGELATTPEGKGHISAPTDGAAAIVETQGRAVVIDVPGTEDDGSGEGASPAGQVGALWTASAELELVESSMYVTATLEVIDSNDVPVATSGPVRLEYGAPTRITARPQEGIEGTMDSVRVALSLVNEEEPNFEVTVDEVILEAADYGDDEEQQFFDGSMPGILWQGTPHLSTSWWDGEPRWIEAQDEKLKNEVFKTTDEIRDELDEAADQLAAAQEWLDETGYELGDRLETAEQELEAARGRLEEAETALTEAQADIDAAGEWISQTGEQLDGRIRQTEGAVGTVGDLLEEVRANSGRRQWEPETITLTHAGSGTDYARVEPLGNGRVRVTALLDPYTLFSVDNVSYDGPVVTVQFSTPGEYRVRVLADLNFTDTFTLTPAMMADDYGWVEFEMPDIDWTDARIGLDQLTDTGLLDPDVWARLYEDVVVGGVVGATEAFIGQNAIIENAIHARHITASESLTAKIAQFLRVTTDMLLVGAMNRLPDPHFEDADLTAAREARDSNFYFYFVPGTDAETVRRYAIPVEPGERYRVTIPISGGHSSMDRVEFWGADGTGRRYDRSDISDVVYADGVLSYVVTVPDGYHYMGPLVYRSTTNWSVQPGATVHLMADSRLIVDGAVTAEKLTITGDPDNPDEASLVANIASIMELDVENLRVTDGAIIDTAVVRELWNQVVRSRKIATDMLYVGGSNLIPDPNFEDADLTEERRSRSAATLVSGSLRATSYFYFLPSSSLDDIKRYAIPVQPGETYRIEIPVDLSSLLSTTARVEVFTATGNRILQAPTFADVSYENGVLAYDFTVPSGRVYMSPVVYRTTSFTVHPGTTVRQKVASNLIVKGGVTAEHLNVLYDDPTTGNRLSLQPDGLRLWGENDDGEPTISLTTSEAQQFAILDSNDNIVAGMDSEGGVLGRVGSFDVLRVGGTDLSELTNNGPRGVVLDRNFPLPRRMTSLGGHSYITFDMEQGRQYEVKCRVKYRNRDSRGIYLRFYQNQGNKGGPWPGEPSVLGGNNSSLVLHTGDHAMAESSATSAFSYREVSFTVSAGGTVDKTINILLGAEPFTASGAGQVEVAAAWWTVYDIGRTGTGSGGSYSTSGGGSSGGGSQPPPETPTQRYTQTYTSTAWRTFQNVGTTQARIADDAISGPLQGQTPYYTTAGRYATHFYFNSAAIRSDIGNGTVLSARVRPRVVHSHSGAGGTVRMYRHGYNASAPSWGSNSYIGETHFARGERRWLGANSNLQGWSTGANRGIGFYSGGSTSSSYYVQFATSIELEITYER